ncbi:hypothetical protein FI667_g7229, partial [Globisporangium splendens]
MLESSFSALLVLVACLFVLQAKGSDGRIKQVLASPLSVIKWVQSQLPMQEEGRHSIVISRVVSPQTRTLFSGSFQQEIDFARPNPQNNEQIRSSDLNPQKRENSVTLDSAITTEKERTDPEKRCPGTLVQASLSLSLSVSLRGPAHASLGDGAILQSAPESHTHTTNMRNTLIALALSLLVLTASGSPAYRSRIPNGFNVPNVPAVGHSDSQGNSDSLNAFGKAFDKAGKKWTVALCQADSDGDGQTNGQELGDPCCVWATGGTPLRVSGLSDPGAKASMSDPTLWASQNCTMTSSPSTNSTSTTSISVAPSGAFSIATAAFAAGAAIATLGATY